MKSRVLSALCFAGVAAGLAAPMVAEAGNWSADALQYNGQPARSLPLWYEYRVSVNAAPGAYGATDGSWAVGTVLDGANARAVIWKGTAPYALSVPAGQQSYVMDIGQWIAAGWISPGDPAKRQAAMWTTEGRAHVEQHSALARSGLSGWEISALYATTFHSVGYHGAGYVRERVSPSTLSKPALWYVNDHNFSTSTVHADPSPHISIDAISFMTSVEKSFSLSSL